MGTLSDSKVGGLTLIVISVLVVLAALFMAAYSVAGLDALLYTELVHNADLKLIYDTGVLLTIVVVIWIIIPRIGLYQDHPSLKPPAPSKSRG